MSNINRLENIKGIIESLNKGYHIEILKLINNESSVSTTENNNGTFVNLTDLDPDVILKLEKYIEYVNKQENQLLDIEKEKTDIKNEFFKPERRNYKIKQNKEETNVIVDA